MHTCFNKMMWFILSRHPHSTRQPPSSDANSPSRKSLTFGEPETSLPCSQIPSRFPILNQINLILSFPSHFSNINADTNIPFQTQLATRAGQPVCRLPRDYTALTPDFRFPPRRMVILYLYLVRNPAGVRNFISSKTVQTVSRPIQPHLVKDSFPGVKRLRREFDHSPPSSVWVQDECRYTFTALLDMAAWAEATSHFYFL